jgi:hypothetical protein
MMAHKTPWDGYPPNSAKDGWHWLGHGKGPYNEHAAHWSAERQIWTQGGICCGGSISPRDLLSGYKPPVEYLGAIPERALGIAAPDMLTALQRVAAYLSIHDTDYWRGNADAEKIRAAIARASGS